MNAGDRTAPDRDIDVGQPAVDIQTGDGHHVLPARMGGIRRVEIADAVADDRMQHFVDIGLSGVEIAGVAAVTQHHDPVGDGEHLLEIVGDVDDGDAFGLQPADDAEQKLTSSAASAAVGSSMISTRASPFIARAISTSLWT